MDQTDAMDFLVVCDLSFWEVRLGHVSQYHN